MATKNYTDEDGNVFSAQLIPAKVVITRSPVNGTPHIVGQVDAAVLGLDKKQQFGEEIVEAGAQRWTRETSSELLGIGK